MNPPDVFDRVEPGARKANKRQILRAALQSFDEHGIDATTVEAIRDRAASSIGSIYHHFGNKDGLLASIYFIALDDQLAQIGPRIEAASNARDAVAALVRAYLTWVVQEPCMARFMYRARSHVASGPHREALAGRNRRRYQPLVELLFEGVEAGSVRELPLEVYASLLIGPAENYCSAWLSGRVKGKPTDYEAVFVDAAWRSIAV